MFFNKSFIGAVPIEFRYGLVSYRLKEASIPFRLVTNETCLSRKAVLEKLLYHKFSVCEADIFSPVPAVVSILKSRGLIPHLLVHPAVSMLISTDFICSFLFLFFLKLLFVG